MKYIVKIFSLFFFLTILITCKRDKPTEEEIITQHEQNILDKIDGFMPDQVGSMFKTYFNINRGQKDYRLYLDSIATAIDELKAAIQLNFSLDDYKKTFNNSLTSLEGSRKGSPSNCLGLGYAKGVRLEGGVSGVVGSVIAMGLQASGGGGIKTTYDFVNEERQIYYYTFCGSGVSFGTGIAAALKANVGFSGINEIITGIRYHPYNVNFFPFEGQGIGKSFSLDPQIGIAFGGGVGIGLSIGIGTSCGAVADFTGTDNLSFCPGYKVEIENGTTSYSLKVTGTISAIAGFADIGAYLSLNTTMTNSTGVNGTNTNFSSNRTLAGIRMATEITLTGPMNGIISIPGPIDLAASTVAIIYSFKDFSNCPAEIPAIGTKTISSLASTSAASGGIIKDARGANVISRGVVWSTSENPTITDKIGITNDGQGTGDYASNIANLTPGITYYIRAYATNSAGTGYGAQVSFTTPQNVSKPIVTTTPVTNFNTTSATVGGNVTSSGGANVTENGVYWGTLQSPELTGIKLQIGSGTGPFSTTIQGLNPGKTYYVKAYAINSKGTAYGPSDVPFTTLSTVNKPPDVPTNISPTDKAKDISTSPTLSWTCSDPENDQMKFDVFVGTTNPPTTLIKSDLTSLNYTLSSPLSAETPYYWKVVAKDDHGNSTPGPVWSFTTATVVIAPVADFIAEPTNINPGETVYFSDKSTNNPTEWQWNFGDLTTSQDRNPNHKYNSPGQYSVTLTVNNSAGTPSSKTISNFITVSSVPGPEFNPNLTYGSVSDIDGNSYRTILIGTQVWMAENLKTTIYNDGTNIQLLTGLSSSQLTAAAGYYWYNDLEAIYKDPYGALYNWYSLDFSSNGGKNICPTGWHVSTDNDWTTMKTFLGVDSILIGNKLKEAGATHWQSPNNGTNESGFTALPVGDCGWDGPLYFSDGYSSWWDYSTATQSCQWIDYDSYQPGIQKVDRFKEEGNPVRCVKDN